MTIIKGKTVAYTPNSSSGSGFGSSQWEANRLPFFNAGLKARIIGADKIRINTKNKNCRYVAEPKASPRPLCCFSFDCDRCKELGRYPYPFAHLMSGGRYGRPNIMTSLLSLPAQACPLQDNLGTSPYHAGKC